MDYEYKEDVMVFINEDREGVSSYEIGEDLKPWLEENNYNVVKIIFGKNLQKTLDKVTFIINQINNTVVLKDYDTYFKMRLIVYDLGELGRSKYELFTVNYLFWCEGITIESFSQGIVKSDDPSYGDIEFKLDMYDIYEEEPIEFVNRIPLGGGYY